MHRLDRDLRVGRPDTIDREKPVLIVLAGLPRSGKSTWAREQGLPIVNPDSVRLAMHGKPFLAEAEPWVWACVKTMVKALFISGHFAVIVDATNITQKRRSDWANPAIWRLAFKVFDTSAKECSRRAIETAREDLLKVIEKMAGQWEPLESYEGFRLDDLVPIESK
jgi:predicted kinase